MQQNRDRNGRPRNTRPYDLNRDVARTSAPSQDHTPRSTGSSRYGYNGEPLSRPPSRSANGGVRSSRADNSIQFPRQGRQMSGSAGQNGAGRSSSPPSPRPAARRRGAIPPSTPLAAARRAADPKTRSLAASSAARQTMPAAGRTTGKTRTRKTIRTGSTRQPAKISACARRRAPRSRALPGGSSAKSAR